MKKIILFLVLFGLIVPSAPSAAVMPNKAIEGMDQEPSLELIPIEKKELPPSPDLAIITGSATFQHKDGNKQALKRLFVYLCPDSIKAEIEGIRVGGRLIAEKIGEYKALFSDLVLIRGKVEAKKLHRVQSDNASTYSIANVKKGSYYLFADYLDTSSAAYWLIPVTVTDNATITITLDNTNTRELINKK